jgi:hypothetical protein
MEDISWVLSESGCMTPNAVHYYDGPITNLTRLLKMEVICLWLRYHTSCTALALKFVYRL